MAMKKISILIFVSFLACSQEACCWGWFKKATNAVADTAKKGVSAAAALVGAGGGGGERDDPAALEAEKKALEEKIKKEEEARQKIEDEELKKEAEKEAEELKKMRDEVAKKLKKIMAKKHAKFRELGFEKIESDFKISTFSSSVAAGVLKVVAVSSSGKSFSLKQDKTGWDLLADKVSSISVGSNGEVWALSDEIANLWNKEEKKFEPKTEKLNSGMAVEWSPVEKEIGATIFVFDGKNILAFGDDLSTWKKGDEEWNALNVQSRSIGFADGTIYRLGKDLIEDGGKVYVFEESLEEWKEVYSHIEMYEETSYPMVQFSVGSKNLIAMLDGRGRVFLSNGPFGSEKFSWIDQKIDSVKEISVTADGRLLILLADGSLFLRESAAVLERIRKKKEKIAKIKREAEEAKAKEFSAELKKLGFEKIKSLKKFVQINVAKVQNSGETHLVGVTRGGEFFEKIGGEDWKKIANANGKISLAEDGTILASVSGIVYQLNRKTGAWDAISKKLSIGITPVWSELETKVESEVAASSSGTHWTFGSDLSVWKYHLKKWKQMPGMARSIATSKDGSILRLDKDLSGGGTLFLMTAVSGKWQRIYEHKVEFAASNVPIEQVSIASQKHLAFRDRVGNVWVNSGPVFLGGAWNKLAVNAKDLEILTDGTIVILTEDGSVFAQNKDDKNYTKNVDKGSKNDL
jgi:flagellar motor protein MotB